MTPDLRLSPDLQALASRLFIGPVKFTVAKMDLIILYLVLAGFFSAVMSVTHAPVTT